MAGVLMRGAGGYFSNLKIWSRNKIPSNQEPSGFFSSDRRALKCEAYSSWAADFQLFVFVFSYADQIWNHKKVLIEQCNQLWARAMGGWAGTGLGVCLGEWCFCQLAESLPVASHVTPIVSEASALCADSEAIHLSRKANFNIHKLKLLSDAN